VKIIYDKFKFLLIRHNKSKNCGEMDPSEMDLGELGHIQLFYIVKY